MKNSSNKQEYINLKEASEIFGLDSRTMKKIWLSTNELHFTTVGRQKIINKKQLLKYFDEHDVIKY